MMICPPSQISNREPMNAWLTSHLPMSAKIMLQESCQAHVYKVTKCCTERHYVTVGSSRDQSLARYSLSYMSMRFQTWYSRTSNCMLMIQNSMHAPIKSQADKEQLQSNIDTLEELTRDWLLNFSADKCKLVQIGRPPPRTYTMTSKSGARVELRLTKEKDVGVWATSNLKPPVQCQKASKKAMQYLGMVRRLFKHRQAHLWWKIKTPGTLLTELQTLEWRLNQNLQDIKWMGPGWGWKFLPRKESAWTYQRRHKEDIQTERQAAD